MTTLFNSYVGFKSRNHIDIPSFPATLIIRFIQLRSAVWTRSIKYSQIVRSNLTRTICFVVVNTFRTSVAHSLRNEHSSKHVTNGFYVTRSSLVDNIWKIWRWYEFSNLLGRSIFFAWFWRHLISCHLPSIRDLQQNTQSMRTQCNMPDTHYRIHVLIFGR